MAAVRYASTTLLRSRSQFNDLLSTVRGISRGRLLLYALSYNAPDIENSLKDISSCSTETIGCLSSPIFLTNASDSQTFSCSIALLDDTLSTPFDISKTGKGPVQVGRWHAFRKEETSNSDHLLDNNVDWNNVWKARGSTNFLPDEMKNIRDAETFLYFSDTSSTEFANALQKQYPHSRQLGVSASSTPFITGLPFTLMRNGKPQSTGAVGVALRARPSSKVLNLDGLVRLTQALPVGRSEGNLIHELGDSLPARILVQSIQEFGLPSHNSKDVDFYIALRDNFVDSELPVKVHRIIAGSPSQGSIAVDDAAAPAEGKLIELCFRLKTQSIELPSELRSFFPLEKQRPGRENILFGAFVDNIDGKATSQSHEQAHSNEVTPCFTNSLFLVSSENGFVSGGAQENAFIAPWKCDIPGAFAGLHLPSQRE